MTVSPIVSITDVDSTQLGSATVAASGGTIGYGTLPSGVTATQGAGSVTFTGSASLAAYQELLQSITLTSGSAGIVTVSFTVVDDQGKASVPASSVVTVLGVPVAVAPVVITTPNAEYNVMWETLPAGQFRHRDHRFEWTREEFRSWAESVAGEHDYAVHFLPIGPVDATVGSPTQMGVFEKLTSEAKSAYA